MAGNSLMVVSVGPIVASLEAIKERYGPLDLRGKSEEQIAFLKTRWDGYATKAAIPLKMDYAVAFSWEELRSFFAGLRIKAAGMENSGEGLKLASFMNISPLWNRAGSSVDIRIETAERVRLIEGVWLSAGVLNFHAKGHRPLISEIAGAVPGSFYYLTQFEGAAPQSGTELLEKVAKLSANIPTGPSKMSARSKKSRGVVFPQVPEQSQGHELPIFKGMALKDELRIGMVYQHFSFALGKEGKEAGDSRRSSFLKATGHNQLPNHVIRGPFMIWQQDAKGRIVFASYVGEKAFQDCE